MGMPLEKVFGAALIFFSLLILGLMNYKFKRYSPYWIYFYATMQVTTMLLQVYDLMPEMLVHNDKKLEEFKIITTLIIVHSVNYTPFLFTLILYPIIFLVSAYLMLVK